ncbi:uncharacterized protein LOC132174181 [Corylus avellana]|uniref:uncharacterized protein LOC132174181 n=1 Tax=Corylus avellana TaxID=13451 RepID=UPI00286B4B96|nr:uncharacterized protein LOC132174181 [Corylus avellana]
MLLYALIRGDVKVLDRIDKLPFVETPLHVAAFAGHTRFASEIMRLKPSFSRKRNEDGFTPVHLALQNNKTEVVRQLLDVDQDLVRAQGKEGVTPLHYVALTGNLVLLAEFLNVCPKSIKDVTIRRDTAFHIALKNNKVDAFNILMKWYEKTRFNDVLASQNKQDKNVLLSGYGNLLNSKDEEGNTLLHIAVSQNQPKVVRRLLNNVGVTINSENLEGCTIWQGQTPISSEMRRMLHRARVVLRLCPFRRAITHEVYLRSNFVGDFRKCMLLLQIGITNELRSILLVVAVLYLTINFQLVLTPSGGLWPDNCDPQHNPIGNCTVPHQAGKDLAKTLLESRRDLPRTHSGLDQNSPSTRLGPHQDLPGTRLDLNGTRPDLPKTHSRPDQDQSGTCPGLALDLTGTGPARAQDLPGT